MTKGSTPLGDTNEKTRMPFGVLVFLSVNLMTRGVEPERARASMRRSGGPPNSERSEDNARRILVLNKQIASAVHKGSFWCHC